MALVVGMVLPGPIRGADHASSPRVPTALAWDAQGRLIVAQREALSLAIVDPGGWRVVEERPVGLPPVSVAVTEDGTIAVGGRDGQTLLIRPDSSRVQVPAGRGETRVIALTGGRVASGSLWDNAVRIVETKGGQVVAVHPLPFEPGSMVALPDGRVLVSDAFRNGLVAFTPGEVGSEVTWRLDLFNLRGLTLSESTGEVFLVGLDSPGSTQVSRTSLDWGLVLSAKLAVLPLELLAEGRGGRISPRRLTLDGSGNGAGDPSAVVVLPDGDRMLVTSAAAHQVLLNDRKTGGAPSPGYRPVGDSLKLRTVAVGRSPAALTLDPTGRFAITADAMGATLTVIDIAYLAKAATVELSPAGVARPVELEGEALFRDGRAALDRWITCASCHPGGHSNSLNFDTLGDGSYGEPKNTPTLLGSADTAPYAWTGRFATLEAQADQSLRTSLHGPAPTPEQAAAIAAYLRSLAPAPPVRDPADPAAVRGRAAFEARRCDSCHVPPTYTSRPLRDPWAEDDSDGLRYSPPSLRGVARTAPYFHDGRAADLDAALSIHHPNSDEAPGPEERAELRAFLESL